MKTAKENPERRLEIAAFTSLVLLSIAFIIVVVAYGTLAF